MSEPATRDAGRARGGASLARGGLLALSLCAGCAASADHYAASRYLVFYLQEHGLLDAFHESFLLHHSRDPSGRRTLERVLDERLDRFDRRWRAWVMGLEQQPVYLTFNQPERVRGKRWKF